MSDELVGDCNDDVIHGLMSGDWTKSFLADEGIIIIFMKFV